MVLGEGIDGETGCPDHFACMDRVSTEHRAVEAGWLAGPKGVAETGFNLLERELGGVGIEGTIGDPIGLRTSSRPVMWSAWAWVQRIASMRGMAQSRSSGTHVGRGIDKQPLAGREFNDDAGAGAAVPAARRDRSDPAPRVRLGRRAWAPRRSRRSPAKSRALHSPRLEFAGCLYRGEHGENAAVAAGMGAMIEMGKRG